VAAPHEAGRLMLGAAVARLIEVIEEENAALQQSSVTSHAGFTDRKNQCLRELMIAQRRESTQFMGEELRVQLRRLAQLLQANGTLLKNHISAVGEVSDIIIAGLKGADSDGTYSRGAGLARWR